MKQKTLKIASTTLFVYKSNKSVKFNMPTTLTDPTTATLTTTLGTGYVQRGN